MAAARKPSTRKRATAQPSWQDVMYGSATEPGIVHLVKQNTVDIGELVGAQKATQVQLSDPEHGLISAVNKMADEQKADRTLQAKLHAAHDVRWRWVYRVSLTVLIAFATIGLLDKFPAAAKVLEYLHY